MRRKYAKAVKYLTLVPSEKHSAWAHPSTHLAGCLFSYCTPDGRPHAGEGGVVFGDPMRVSRGRAEAWTAEMRDRLRAQRLPWQPWRLTRLHLYLLAEAQRDMDDTIRSRAWRKEHRYSLPYRWPDDDFYTEDIDGWAEPDD